VWRLATATLLPCLASSCGDLYGKVCNRKGGLLCVTNYCIWPQSRVRNIAHSPSPIKSIATERKDRIKNMFYCRLSRSDDKPTVSRCDLWARIMAVVWPWPRRGWRIRSSTSACFVFSADGLGHRCVSPVVIWCCVCHAPIVTQERGVKFMSWPKMVGCHASILY